jgi:hypothetical protein
MTMRKIIIALALAAVAAATGVHVVAQTPADRATMDDIRSKLLRLPY